MSDGGDEDVNQDLQVKYSYLDIVGRTVVVLQKDNVVPTHNVPFQVYYTFKPIYMLAEPLMLVSAFFFVFVTSLAWRSNRFSQFCSGMVELDLAIHQVKSRRRSSRTSDVLQTDPRRPTNIAVSHFGDRSPHEPDLFEDESAAVWDRMD
ncbi:hypothetical protein F2Q68_00036093 [Brassica cretica]|uniref:Dolichyl-diphosphooligosaccharide--protein glycosyltransferase subunit 1 n=1 Tax=Brassica cretica TaxID=69181 RepID=A0A8S9H3E3_BRACR|nr:hypothetical protein F2Q68_00036093 [Brassica cretica]